MADRVKGITIEIGGDTLGLSKALSGVNKDIKSTESQLKDVERLLKLDPTNTKLLEQKQRLLAEAVSETGVKLEALKEAEKQVQEQFERGEVSREQYDALQREIIATEHSLKQLEARAESNAEALESASKKADGLGDEFSDASKGAEDLADAVEDAEKSAKGAGDGFTILGGTLADLTSSVIQGAVSKIGDLVSSLFELSEATEEYRQMQAKLSGSAEAFEHDVEGAQKQYAKLYTYLGDDQAATNAVTNLLGIGESMGVVGDLTDAAISVWTAYGDSIPIESLTESINETAQVGKVTGVLADALTWAGESEDEFNEALQKFSTTESKAIYIAQRLNAVYGESKKTYDEMSGSILDANAAELQMKDTQARLGEAMEPLNTTITQIKANILEQLAPAIEAVAGLLNDFLNWLQESPVAGKTLTAVLAGMATTLGILATALGIQALVNGVQKAFAALNLTLSMNPILLVIALIAGLVAALAVFGDEVQEVLQKVDDFLQGVFARDWTQVFGGTMGTVLNTFFANVKNIWDAVKQILNGIIDFIRGVFTGNWTRAWDGVKSIFSGIFSGFKAIAKAPLNAVIGFLNGAISGINKVISALNKINVKIPSWVPIHGGKSFGFSLSKLSTIPYLAKGGILYDGSAVVGEAGPELLTVNNGRAIVQPLSNNGTSNAVTTNMGGITVNINAAQGQSVNAIADAVMRRMEHEVAKKGAAW